MDAVKKFRLKRINRLEKRFGPRNGLVRFDDDDEANSNNNSKSGSGGHGNTRIPFGLCQREGITIESGWTPTDAWNALEGKGYSASSVYKQLSKTGKVTGGQSSARPKDGDEIKKSIQTVVDYKAKKKRKQEIDDDIKNLQDKINTEDKKIKRAESEIRWYDKWFAEVEEKYGDVDSMPSYTAERYRYNKEQSGKYKAEIEKRTKRKEKLNKKMEASNKELSELGWNEEDENYKTASKSILETSHVAKSVQRFREIEDESEETRKTLSALDEKINKEKFFADSYRKWGERKRKEAEGLSDDDPMKPYKLQDAEAHDKRTAEHENNVKELEKKRAEFAKKVSEYDKRMSDEKGDTDEESWNAVYDLTVERDTVKDENYSNDLFKGVSDSLKRMKVDYKSPVKYAKTPSEEDIINRLCGGDETSGSCASVAFAYFANKAGYRVLDFRGGASREYFSHSRYYFLKQLGAIGASNTNDYTAANELFEQMKVGKEYWFATGKHAAIVRRNGEHDFEFLELQDEKGQWEKLTSNRLKDRFGCQKSHSVAGRKIEKNSMMIDFETLTNHEDFIKIIGFLNTDEDKQKKGVAGGIK